MNAKEIQEVLAKGNVVIGKDNVLKNLKIGKVVKVIIAKNAEELLIMEIDHFKQFSDFEVEKLNVTNEEFGVLCKKRFAVSVLGIIK